MTLITTAILCPICSDPRSALGGREPGRCGRCGFVPGRTPAGVPVLLPAGSYGSEIYESERVVAEYLAFHYPDPAADPLAALLGEAAPEPAQRFPYAIAALIGAKPGGHALDVGCACGRVTLDLARSHASATGLDRSLRLVDAAQAVETKRLARYRTILEGELCRTHEVAVEVAAPVRWLVGDALALPFPDGSFDTVVGLNLLDRVPDPARALAELARVVAPAGELVISSPYTWLPEYAPADRWLGGTTNAAGEPVRAGEEIQRRLTPAFERLRETMMPFFIPHHARSGQLALTHVQCFRRIP